MGAEMVKMLGAKMDQLKLSTEDKESEVAFFLKSFQRHLALWYSKDKWSDGTISFEYYTQNNHVCINISIGYTHLISDLLFEGVAIIVQFSEFTVSHELGGKKRNE